jgi:hypothetical protein
MVLGSAFDRIRPASICGSRRDTPSARATLLGLKCEPSIHAYASPPPTPGCTIDSSASGTTYFLDLINDSSTSRIGPLRGMLPGTCEMTDIENSSSGRFFP